jgi:hypothetical protein
MVLQTFVYNDKMDRIELCLDDLGHYEIEPDVEFKARAHANANNPGSQGSHGRHGHGAVDNITIIF